MKLLITGLVLLAGAAGVALVTYFNPATLFIGGGVCTFLGVIDLIRGPRTGVAVSDGDINDQKHLASLQVYGSADRSARFIDGQ
ncbi:MAG: hypothetical protein WDO17_05080 [Alphaproteobacteria bacterium]